MLQEFITNFREKKSEIDAWLEEKRKILGPEPLYSSVDLRNSGYKVVPVDTNLFPAGWNNLCAKYQKRTSEYFRDYFDLYFPGTQCLVILPEDHTRNLYYFSNIKKLQGILEEAGFEVNIGTLNPELDEETRFMSQENEEIVLYKIHRDGDNIFVNGKKVCQVIINNDFSGGIPDILKGIKQNLLPSPEIGWHSRKKSTHFEVYDKLIEEFCSKLHFDPWHFRTHFAVLENVDFDNSEGREKVAVVVDELITKIKADYEKRNITTAPSIFIKNNAGTYGMAVIRVNSGDDVRNLNQKTRKQMRVGKGSVDIKSVILQEGVNTVDRVKDLVAEPVIYLVGNNSVGGFYRLNDQKGDDDNLNSKGMQFSKSCLLEDMGYQNKHDETLTLEDLAQVYEVIATIASLAAGFEIKELSK